MEIVSGCDISNVFFFFSSRRRHTRFDCDWSSDVCSSDLPAEQLEAENDSKRRALETAMTRLGDEREEGRIRDEDSRTEGPEQAKDNGGAPGHHANEARDADERIACGQGPKPTESPAHMAEEERDEGPVENPHRDRDLRVGN